MDLGWIAIAAFSEEAEARLVAGRLEAEGIETRLYPEFQGGYYGESVNLPVRVLVPEHRILEARALLDQLETG
jgi:hypothetical protein